MAAVALRAPRLHRRQEHAAQDVARRHVRLRPHRRLRPLLPRLQADHAPGIHDEAVHRHHGARQARRSVPLQDAAGLHGTRRGLRTHAARRRLLYRRHGPQVRQGRHARLRCQHQGAGRGHHPRHALRRPLHEGRQDIRRRLVLGRRQLHALAPRLCTQGQLHGTLCQCPRRGQHHRRRRDVREDYARQCHPSL